MPFPSNEASFDIWAVVELMGHRRVTGRVTEQEIAGAGFLRIDIPTDPPQTQFYAPASIYGITPVSEDAARLAARRVADPVTVWELPENIRRAINTETEYVDDSGQRADEAHAYADYQSAKGDPGPGGPEGRHDDIPF